MTTEPMAPHRRRPGNVAVPAAMSIAGVAAAASVAWAAATPPTPTQAPAPAAQPAAESATQQQLVELQKSLSQVRRDLLRVRAVHLPRARVPASTGGASSGYVGTSTPSFSLPAVPPAPAAAAPPPASQAVTGASGAVH